MTLTLALLLSKTPTTCVMCSMNMPIALLDHAPTATPPGSPDPGLLPVGPEIDLLLSGVGAGAFTH